MPREIKFRGQTVNEVVPRFAYGMLIKEGDSYFIDEHECLDTLTMVDKDTIGQYTGCKDMDGKEIYEGDILEFEWIEDSCWGPEGTYRGYVRHDDGGFEVVYINRQEYTKCKDGGRHPNSEADELQSFIRYTEGVNIKILGNVCETPELLEVEQ